MMLIDSPFYMLFYFSTFFSRTILFCLLKLKNVNEICITRARWWWCWWWCWWWWCWWSGAYLGGCRRFGLNQSVQSYWTIFSPSNRFHIIDSIFSHTYLYFHVKHPPSSISLHSQHPAHPISLSPSEEPHTADESCLPPLFAPVHESYLSYSSIHLCPPWHSGHNIVGIVDIFSIVT